VAASAKHRGQAYDASRALIDRLKQRVPVWKHQVFAEGDDEWVNAP
jgi:molybdopterin synthase catalytic subunit